MMTQDLGINPTHRQMYWFPECSIISCGKLSCSLLVLHLVSDNHISNIQKREDKGYKGTLAPGV